MRRLHDHFQGTPYRLVFDCVAVIHDRAVGETAYGGKVEGAWLVAASRRHETAGLTIMERRKRPVILSNTRIVARSSNKIKKDVRKSSAGGEKENI